MSAATEKTVLWAIISESAGVVEEAARYLRPEHFALDAHKRIFRHAMRLYEAKSPVNSATLAESIMRAGDAPAVGGVAYVIGLSEGEIRRVSLPTFAHHVALLEQDRRRRRLEFIGQRVSQEAMALPPDEALRRLRAYVAGMETRREESSAIFAPFADFVDGSHEPIDWMVAGVIERGANGFIAAEPKTGKSFLAADLAIALATGTPWLDFAVMWPTKVALVSREDNPKLTAWRLGHLMTGRGLGAAQIARLEANLYVNTRQQTPSLMLDKPGEMAELVGAIKQRGIEFVILDVLNVLHAADENDNTQMAAVLQKVKSIQRDTGASIGILHHYSKNDSATRITQRLRGASAIAGFAEWIVGISMSDEDMGIRQVNFELKAAQPPQPVYFCIEAEEGRPARISRTAPQPQPQARQHRKGVM